MPTVRCRRPLAASPLAALLLAAGCIPYSVGSTAQTVPPGEWRVSGTAYLIPRGVESSGEALDLRGTDLEVRAGVNDRTDLGLRVTSMSGGIVTVKRRLLGAASPDAGVVSVMLGNGLVNMGMHFHAEATLMASAPRIGRVTPYGGLRAMHVLPVYGVLYDTPTTGGYAGARISLGRFALHPEVGIYRDRSALGLRRRDVILVPSVSVSAPRDPIR